MIMVMIKGLWKRYELDKDIDDLEGDSDDTEDDENDDTEYDHNSDIEDDDNCDIRNDNNGINFEDNDDIKEDNDTQIDFDDNDNFLGVAVCYDIKPCLTTILELSIAGHKMKRYDADEIFRAHAGNLCLLLYNQKSIQFHANLQQQIRGNIPAICVFHL